MSNDPALKLSIGEINRRLTLIAREQKRLRALLEIAIEAMEDAEGCPQSKVDPEKQT